MNKTLQFLKNDYRSSPRRFILEAWCTLMYILGTGILAVYSPTPPMLIIYSIWVPTNLMMCYVAYKRGTFSLIILYGTYFILESYGFFNTIKAAI